MGQTENESFTQFPTTFIFERAGTELFYVLILSQQVSIHERV